MSVSYGGDAINSTTALPLQLNGTTFATGNQYGIGLGTAVPSSGIGIAFPATQSASSDANTLDDYEEGTWTPTFGLNSGSLTYSNQSGTYTKVGRQVTVIFYCLVNTSSSGISNGNLSSLPFTCQSSTYAGPSFAYWGTSGMFSTFSNLIGLIGSGSTDIQIRGSQIQNSSPGLAFGGASITAGTALAGTLTYFTN